MKPKRLFILTCIAAIFLQQNLFAQDSILTVQKPVYLKLALFYDFPKSPGANVGIDFPLRSKIKTRVKQSGKIKTRQRDLIFSNNLGFYHLPYNYTALILNSFISQRHLFNNGLYFENGIGLGVMRTFYEGRVYTVDDNNNVKEHNSFGRYYGTIHTALTLGYNFGKHALNKPFAVQLRPSLWFQYPYNSILLPHAALELGIKYHFNHWNVRVKQLYKTKQ